MIETQRTEFHSHDIELGYRYDDGAVVPDGTAPPPRDPMGFEYRPTTRPGHRLPHVWLNHGGRRVSTHDLVDKRGFVLMTDPSGTAWTAAASAVAEGLRIPLRTVTIGENGEYTDPDGAWARLSQLDRGGAVLVRPDHHVAYRSTSPVPDAENALLRALSAVLARLLEPVG